MSASLFVSPPTVSSASSVNTIGLTAVPCASRVPTTNKSASVLDVLITWPGPIVNVSLPAIVMSDWITYVISGFVQSKLFVDVPLSRRRPLMKLLLTVTSVMIGLDERSMLIAALLLSS